MKTKAKGGKHITPRQVIQMPHDWYSLAKKIATKRQQPVIWYLAHVIGEAAEREGIKNLPKYPWD